MAVLSVTECTMLKGTSKSDRDGSPTAQRLWIVRFDSKPADLEAVVNAAGLPVSGELYKVGDARTCKAKSAASMGTVLDYIVTCEYDVLNASLPDSPLARPDYIGGDCTSRRQPYFLDYSDDPQPVLNSTGIEPFDKLPENDVGEVTMTITGNRATVDPAGWAAYFLPACAINSNGFTVRGVSIGAGCAKMKNIRFSYKTEGQFKYYEVQWTLALAPTWDQDIDDFGFFQLTDDTTGIIPIMGADGVTPVSKPYPLDGTGYAIEDPSEVTDNQGVLTFKPQPKMSFSFGWTVGA